MKGSLPVIFVCVLLLVGCTHTKTANAPPKMVSITLYAYPVEWSHELPLKKFSASALRDLTKSKAIYSSTLDLGRGIPVASFAPQRGSRAKIPALWREHSITHVSGTNDLDYLPPPFYHEVGWIDWFLVRRDPSKQVTAIIPEKHGGIIGQKKSLIDQVKDGDELVGAWGF